MVVEVLDKAQSFRLWRTGAYGNKLRAWSTVGEYLRSDFRGKVALRSRRGGGGQFCVYDVPPWEVPLAWGDLVAEGADPDDVMVNEAAPDQHVVLQGEYWNGSYLGRDGYPRSCYLFYSRTQDQMRAALIRAPEVAEGLRADLMIEQVMSPGSREDWEDLKARFPEHVFELSVYDVFLGDVPRRNALVWEVRRY